MYYISTQTGRLFAAGQCLIHLYYVLSCFLELIHKSANTLSHKTG